MIFASDNWAGASDAIARALVDEGRRAAPAYGNDDLTTSVEEAFARLFEREVKVFLLVTGTAANALSLSAFSRPGGVILCHRDAHILADECGAPEFYGGGVKVVGLEGPAGKLRAADLDAVLGRFTADAVHHGQPMAVSISQTTEFGAVYRADEIKDLADLAHRRGLPLHMDGARIANAVAALHCPPADVTWRAGVDVLSFGGSKNGCFAAEAVVFFDPAAAKEFPYLRKRAGHLLSKTRFIAAQFSAYLENNRWLDLAMHANGMAKRLADGLRSATDARLALEPEANAIFANLTREAAARLRLAGALFHDWSVEALPIESRPRPEEVLVRLVTSFRTEEAEVERFLSLV